MADENKEEETLDEEKTSESSEEEISEEETPKETPKETLKETPKEVSKEEEEPPVRIPKEQSTEDKRLGYKIRMLEKEIKDLKGDGYGEEVSRDSVDALRTEFSQKFAEIEDKRESEGMLQSFLDQYPNYKKYSTKIRKFMNHPAYQQVPIGFIADGIAGQDIAKENKEAKNKADEEAKETKTGGSSHRKPPTGKIPDVWEMSKEEFKAYQNEIRQKGRE